MLDQVGIPSPTNSSVSSSDLDTQSTGSFFHDRSTSLGTLMGVRFPTINFRTPLSTQSQAASVSGIGGGRKKSKKKSLILGGAEKGRRWWSLCRDVGNGAKPGSLGEFLEVERRSGEGGDFYGTMEEAEMNVEGVMVQGNGRGVLFSNGRVLPPVVQVEESPSAVFCGICCSNG